MKITSGLIDRQILQRNRKNVCDVLLAGQCSIKGQLQIRVTKANRAIAGLNNKTIASLSKGKFTHRLVGIPAGGPYDIELRLVAKDKTVIETFAVKDILVGDVWILAGQSNMKGRGYLKDASIFC